MIFIDNKYTHWYYNIINRAKTRSLNDYKEKHHIIPKCMGGDNTKNNLVELTAREHFVCHRLLVKMVPVAFKQKMVYAIWSMANKENLHQTRVKATSTVYEQLRKSFSKTHSAWMKENHHFKDPEVFQRFLESLKTRRPTGRPGRKLSEETREKLRNKTWTDKHYSLEQDNCLKNAAARKDKPWSDAMRTSREDTYYNKNKDLANSVFEIMKTESSINAIAKTLTVDWKTVKNIIDRQEGFNKRFGLPK